MWRDSELLELNHASVRRLISASGSHEAVAAYDARVGEALKRWHLLARNHLATARALAAHPRRWRSTVSRAYYAAYNASRAVRLSVYGRVHRGGKDHRTVGELPDDFPERDQWASFLDQLRYERERCDYDPGSDVRASLSDRPAGMVERVAEFVAQARQYLGARGIQL